MKHLNYIMIILITGFLSISCGIKAKELKNELKISTEMIENTSKVAKEGKNIQENMQSLLDKTPLTKVQWQTWLPETLLDMPLFNPQLNFMPELSSCGANYKIGNKRVRIMVIDGAGEKGAGGVGPYMMSSKMDYDTQDTWGYTKTRTINGLKVKESYLKGSDKYTLSMFYNNRFAVDIETHKITQAELEQIIKELDLNKLEQL